MEKIRLDKELVRRGLVSTRSQAESWVRLGKIRVGTRMATKPGMLVGPADTLQLLSSENYVSRAGLKLASIAKTFDLSFAGKLVLDVGSSTGGFTDYALQHGASKVIAVDVGTNQLHPSLHGDERIELHEQTDIRSLTDLSPKPDIVVIDVSFISLRELLPHVSKISGRNAQVVAMVKPQFEAGREQINRGIIKNDRIRRDILKDFETWAATKFVIQNKADSEVAGSKGNLERFYLLKSLR